MKGFSQDLTSSAFWHFPEKTSRLSSPAFRLPRNAVSQERSSDYCHILSTGSSSGTGSLRRVSTRIPEISVLTTFWGRHATRHQKSLDVSSLACCHTVSSSSRDCTVEGELGREICVVQKDPRRSARSFVNAGSQPSLASTLLLRGVVISSHKDSCRLLSLSSVT